MEYKAGDWVEVIERNHTGLKPGAVIQITSVGIETLCSYEHIIHKTRVKPYPYAETRLFKALQEDHD